MVSIQKQYGVVTILDALGTKGIWQRTQPEAIIETWDSIISLWHKRYSEIGDDNYKISFSAFSDTVIVTATGENIEKALIDIGTDIAILSIHAMAQGIFFRGGIGAGEFYSGEKIVIGPVVDEVAQYYILPNWIGISASPSAYNILRKTNTNQIFTPWDIPTKNGIEKGLALNLPIIFEQVRNTLKWGLKIKVPKSLDELLEKELDSTSDFNASLKLRNTIEFFRNVTPT